MGEDRNFDYAVMYTVSDAFEWVTIFSWAQCWSEVCVRIRERGIPCMNFPARCVCTDKFVSHS